jgi:hypothetical protein
MALTQGNQTASVPRRVNRPWVVIFASVGIGLVVYCAGALLELFGGDDHFGIVPTVARVCAAGGPIAVVVWQAMVVSRSWRWLTGAAAVIAIFSFGRWLQGLFGLDPPYIYFVLGIGLQIEATAIGVAVAIGFIASRISRAIRIR